MDGNFPFSGLSSGAKKTSCERYGRRYVIVANDVERKYVANDVGYKYVANGVRLMYVANTEG